LLITLTYVLETCRNSVYHLKHRLLRLLNILLFLVNFWINLRVHLLLRSSKNQLLNFSRWKSLRYLYFQIRIPIIIVKLIYFVLNVSCRRYWACLLIIQTLVIIMNSFETNRSLCRNCKFMIAIFFLVVTVEFDVRKNWFGLVFESVLLLAVHKCDRYRFGRGMLSCDNVHFR
jgi:hypothetical protein